MQMQLLQTESMAQMRRTVTYTLPAAKHVASPPPGVHLVLLLTQFAQSIHIVSNPVPALLSMFQCMHIACKDSQMNDIHPPRIPSTRSNRHFTPWGTYFDLIDVHPSVVFQLHVSTHLLVSFRIRCTPTPTPR